MQNGQTLSPPIRDLADFHLRWQEFRKTALALKDGATLNEAEREILYWLICMADKIGSRDIS
jgi:hypothetical protein